MSIEYRQETDKRLPIGVVNRPGLEHHLAADTTAGSVCNCRNQFETGTEKQQISM
jgi:hypothetical protein